MPWWKGKLLQDLITLASGETVSKIAGFLAFSYLARTLGPEGYGMVELAVSLSVFFAMAINFGYGSIGTREIARDRESAESYTRQIVSARLILTFFAIPMMGLIGIYTSQSDTSSQLIWLFSFGLIAIPWNHNWLMQGLEKMNLVALGQVIRMLVFTLGAFFFVNSIDDILTVGYIEFIAAASMAISYLIMQIKHVGKPRLNFHPKSFIEISKKAVSVGLSNVVWTLNQYIPVILISTLNTTTQLALFAAVHRITSSLVGFSLLYHFNLFPSVSKKINTSATAFQDLAKASTHFTAWGGSAIALFITLLAEEITVFIFGDSFKDAGKALAILIWTLPVTLLSGHSRWALIASNRQRYVLYAQMGSSVTTIIFCIILIPDYDAFGAAIAMVLAAFTVWSIAYYYAAKYICKIPFFSVLIKPSLFSVFSAFLASQINGPFLSVSAAMFTYIALTLIFDQSLLNDIVTLANTKEHHQRRNITLIKIPTNRIILCILALGLISVGMFISDSSLTYWLNKIASGNHLNILIQGSALFKSILVIDGIILLYLGLRKKIQTPINYGVSLWTPNNKSNKQSISFYFILAFIIIVCVSNTINSSTFNGVWIDHAHTVINPINFDWLQILSNFSSANLHKLNSALTQISVHFFGETAFAVKFPALFIAILGILAVASLSRYAFTNSAGLVSAAILAVSYHYIGYSQNTLSYTILLLAGFISTELMLRAIETTKWPYWIVYALIISMAAWVHFTAVFIAIVHGIFYLGLLMIKRKADGQHFNYGQAFKGLVLTTWFTLHIYVVSIPQIVDGFNHMGSEFSTLQLPMRSLYD